MFVGKTTGKALGKEKSGLKHTQGKINSAEVLPFFSHLRNGTLDLLMPSVLSLMAQADRKLVPLVALLISTDGKGKGSEVMTG